MKKILLFLLAVSTQAFSEDFEEKFYSDKQIKPSAHEKAGLAIGRQWLNGANSIKPFQGKNGVITFQYGTGQIQVVCAVLQLCDVSLEEGETVQGEPQIGDPRITIGTYVVGGQVKTQHLTIKPTQVGIDTTLLVPTDRRLYTFRLRSDRHKFMPLISFDYGNSSNDSQWAKVRSEMMLSQGNSKKSGSDTDFNYGYEISGDDVSWKPKEGMVYDDGVKTYIRMTKESSTADLPVFLVLKKEGGLFSDDETQIVNYRVQNNKYTIDGVFDKAVLVAGAGDSKEQVIITRESGK